MTGWRAAIGRAGRGRLELGASYWNGVARRVAPNGILPPAVSWLRRESCLRLLAGWCGERLATSRVLKTDCFEEAFNSCSAFLTIAADNEQAVAIDISEEIVSRARRRARVAGVGARFLCCDVRSLPFADGSYDVVFSHSTLDHFTYEEHVLASLREIRRILAADGSLVLTLDNRFNLGAPLVQLAKLVSPYFIGPAFCRTRAARLLERCSLRVEDSTHLAHSVRILDILVFRLATALSWTRLEEGARRMLHGFDALCARRSGHALFGTYVALKATPR
jgi:SAM-dependent methyltransferase